ncbi:transporter [Pseudomonas alkylphenolica]|uniref:Uncharacterized protein n=1 Tax=Pseudomonas alkylphenolica TaxID=237609 RepID=A0A077FB06_9PSED|nr:transporter [Pseudomonas alkylphenolica]AIL61750.1 hypothetical protein PSAKL28_25500 [Pseudomonas alkylphenolica]
MDEAVKQATPSLPDASKLINLGNNRWSFKPELGISKRLGPVTVELSGAGTFYTDNDEFLRDHTFSQNPIYQVRGHLIYAFSNGVWVALDTTYFAGGSTSVSVWSIHLGIALIPVLALLGSLHK